jgi:trehalose-6-phosphatase
VKTYCFDLDGTLCTITDAQYANAQPIRERIQVVNDLFDKGSKVIIHTARGSTTGIDWTDLTQHQLVTWNVKYHKLQLGKPFADVYIDDKGVKDSDFFELIKNELR